MKIEMNKRFEFKDLPDMKSIMSDVEKLTKDLKIGQTLFLKEHGVKSEGEYKKKCTHVMKHSHIGYNTWDTTKKAAEELYNELTRRGSYIDRFGFCMDNLMGLPEEWRKGQLLGTGLMMKNEDEWMQIGQIVPVQPHCGDMMIGLMNGVENCMNALKAGVTTIGNVSHYYNYEYPGIDREDHRTINTMTAIGIMGKYRKDGVIIHSNLDDGYGGQIQDMANLVGWAKVERYYVETLLGGGLGHCFGNLFSNPIDRIIFKKAIWEMNPNEIPGTMIYGNTTEYGNDMEKNAGALASFILGDIIGQQEHATGSAVVPIPVSEAVRIPTVDEMVAAHMEADMLIKKAPCVAKYLDWGKIEQEKDLLVACGNIFFERVMNGLDGLGVDVTHTGEIMAALKAIGPAQIEEAWGVGRQEKEAMRGRIPVKPTNVVQDLMERGHDIMVQIGDFEGSLAGVKIVMGTTDAHEFGKQLVKDILVKAGANVFDLGTTVSVEEILDAVVETESKIVCVSTYNGIALSYGKDLLAGFERRGLKDMHVIMGGLLNENLDGKELPEDVSQQLRDIGINSDNKAEEMVDLIKSYL